MSEWNKGFPPQEKEGHRFLVKFKSPVSDEHITIAAFFEGIYGEHSSYWITESECNVFPCEVVGWKDLPK